MMRRTCGSSSGCDRPGLAEPTPRASSPGHLQKASDSLQSSLHGALKRHVHEWGTLVGERRLHRVSRSQRRNFPDRTHRSGVCVPESARGVRIRVRRRADPERQTPAGGSAARRSSRPGQRGSSVTRSIREFASGTHADRASVARIRVTIRGRRGAGRVTRTPDSPLEPLSRPPDRWSLDTPPLEDSRDLLERSGSRWPLIGV